MQPIDESPFKETIKKLSLLNHALESTDFLNDFDDAIRRLQGIMMTSQQALVHLEQYLIDHGKY